MEKFVRAVARMINFALQPLQLKLVRDAPKGLGYISGEETIKAAKASNLSVNDYIVKVYGWPDFKVVPEKVIEKMREFGVFNKTISSINICEIGPGSGRFTEEILKVGQPASYEIYETSQDWANWLAEEYNVTVRNGDGETLSYTESASIDLLHAHAIFVYLPFLTAYRYFQEAARVTKAGGFVVFDILSEACFNDQTLEKWLESSDRYPVLLPKSHVTEFFTSQGFCLLGDFLDIGKVGLGKSHYLFFKKQEIHDLS